MEKARVKSLSIENINFFLDIFILRAWVFSDQFLLVNEVGQSWLSLVENKGELSHCISKHSLWSPRTKQ